MDHDCSAKVMSLLQNPKEKFTLRTIEDALQAPNCPVCRMFIHMVAQNQGRMPPITKDKLGRDGQFQISFGWLWKRALGFHLDCQGSEIQNIEVFFGGIFTDAEGFMRYDEASYSMFRIQLGLKEVSTADRSVHIYKRKQSTEDGTIHREFLTSWIEAFTGNHGRKCDPHFKSDPGVKSRRFRLIDVQSLNLVQAPADAAYVALSYVWGANTWLRCTTANKALLEEDAGILRAYSDLPRTIRDAIVLTRQMKKRYLWVDSLCIVQDDLEDKMEQIPSLHTIYEDADLVLVGAYGRDANAGLPGVEPGRFPLRTARRREHIHDKVRLLSGFDKVEPTLKSTVWSTRGWTYQEFEMSRVQLVLAPSQAYLRCRCGAESAETIALDVFNQGIEDKELISQQLWQSEIHTIRYTEFSMWNDFTLRVRAYSERQLTAPEDVLNAFSAVMKFLERKFDIKFYFGLPLSAFNKALQWTDFGDSFDRRDCAISIWKDGKVIECPAPSWSWAGWIGQVDYPAGMNTEGEGQGPVISEANWKSDISHVPVTEDNPIRHVLIQAWTGEAYFDLGEKRWDKIEAYGYPIYDITSKKQVGHIRIPDSVYWTGPGRARFIYLSRRRKPRFWYQTYWAHDIKFPEIVAEVMLVTAEKEGVSFRIAVGSINWRDWIAARSVERSVTLG